MSYRIDKRKRLVMVAGEADMDIIIAKVGRIGGTGWRVVTQIPADLVERVVERVAETKHEHRPRPIGFRTITSDDEHGLVTGLPFTPPTVEEE